MGAPEAAGTAPGTPGATAAAIHRARIANVRQRLLGPVTAITGYAELLLADARKDGPEAVVSDLEKIAEAGAALAALVEGLVATEARGRERAPEDPAAVQSRLRHDLRNPLNAIRGYVEIVLEDLEETGGTALRGDLDALWTECQRLLWQIDVIVDFSTGAEEAEIDDAEAAMVGDLVRTIASARPRGAEAMLKGHILVVDDDPSNRSLLVRRLARDGHRVAEADNGEHALRLLAAEPFDVVLLDLLMPGMNGFEVLRAIKADPSLRELRVLMVSGQQETQGVLRCIEAGAEDYLPKPVDAILLDARIHACLEGKSWRDRERAYLDALKAEKEKSEALLHNILPAPIIARMNAGETLIADRFEDVTVLFADVVGFVAISSRLDPPRLVQTLNTIFSAFDALAREFGVEKIKTIGDAYMAVAGLPGTRPDHAPAMADMALAMMAAIARIETTGDRWQLRIGVHTGPVIAGVIGRHKFVYDVWGDTVNLASRLESTGRPGRIQISEALARRLARRFRVEPAGVVAVKGKGRTPVHVLLGREG